MKVKPIAQYLTALSFSLIGAAGVFAEEPAEAWRADMPYQAEKSNPVTHQVEMLFVVTPPAHCELLKVWLPLPQSDSAQEISGGKLSTFPETVTPQINTEPVYGNKFAYFEFKKPAGGQVIRHRFTAKVWELNWSVDPQRVTAEQSWHASFSPYLQNETISQENEFAQVLAELAPAKTPAAKLKGVIDWVDGNLTYSHAKASLAADADHAFRTRGGHCSDFHGLCAVMGRRLGYPARVTYGLSLFPKSSPSHCKLEAFLPPYGWVSYDVSETQKLIDKIGKNNELTAEEKTSLAAAARRRLHAGFRENSWLLVTRGVNYDLSPPASQKVRVVRTLYAEADGIPLPEPDPSNEEVKQFSWMTAHRYQSDAPFQKPFQDISTLK